MKLAATIAVYNEAANISRTLDALLVQSIPLDEIVIVDDGSTDHTGEIVKAYGAKHSSIKYIHQTNAGPAVARNRAWQAAGADICLFTDGDCVPAPDWAEKLTAPFAEVTVGATGGTYKTLNPESILARFIGLEIDWKYRNVTGNIEIHGSYNLAVRRSVLEETGGYPETYDWPSGEDWELTNNISENHQLIFVREAVVGHYHPEGFIAYMKNQQKRGRDRVLMYQNFPERISGDTYTPWYTKYQVLAAGASLPSLVFALPLFPFSFLVPILIHVFLLLTFLLPFPFYMKKNLPVAFYSLFIQYSRGIAWFLGLVNGFWKYGFRVGRNDSC